MSIATIFLIILLAIILRPIIKVYMMFRRYKKAVNDAFGFDPRTQSAGRQHRENNPPRQHDKKKVITRDMGEYVAYEEVTDTSADKKQSHAPEQEHGTKFDEEQITDAEWEEIPSGGGKTRL